MTDRPYDDAMIDRCCLYLLGELPAAEAAAFEQQSAASSELRACLAEQAELLAELGIALAGQPQSQPQSLQTHPTRKAHWLSSRGAVAAALALAASLLIGVGLQWNGELDREESPETLQLAHAWAAGRGELEWNQEWNGSPWRSNPLWEETELPLEPLATSERESAEPAVAAETSEEPLGPPQWLLVAVRAMEAEQSPAAESPAAAAATEAGDE